MMDIDNFFSAFTYKPSNPFTIEKTVQSQLRQPPPTPMPPPRNASSCKRLGRASKNPNLMLAASTSSSSSTATTGGRKPVVVSRYFLPSHVSSSLLTDAPQPRQPPPTPVPPPRNASSCKRLGRASKNRNLMLAASTSSSSSTATTGGGKPVVVSRYFLPSHVSSSLLTDAPQPRQPPPTPVPPPRNASSCKRLGRASKNPNLMLAASTSSSSSTATTGGGKPVVVSRYFLPSHVSSSLLTDAPPLRAPHAKASGADRKKKTTKRKRDCVGVNPNEKKRRVKKVPYFSAAEKRSEAYRRVADNNTWDPPASCYHLLQERHSVDPWRVLMTCMLLNVTTGFQVEKVLPGLFLMCPNAEAMSKIDEKEVEEIIRPLGLQKKRAKMLKRFSCEYIRNDWVYVTELHGIGKYAADAYAIFCNGKMKEVTPRDHKLVAYWKLLCNKEFVES
ncbi:uncharacterized protein LOC141838447 isoform X2 [Curcuma longa]|uniref:uncharacterized protein LOC141838447 isoform X2 n=1 Tax=Curcuma longa TaxID=136217 RepID=UPI003D9F1D67